MSYFISYLLNITFLGYRNQITTAFSVKVNERLQSPCLRILIKDQIQYKEVPNKIIIFDINIKLKILDFFNIKIKKFQNYNTAKMLRKNKNDQESEIQEGEEISENEESSEFIKVKYSGRTNFCEICQNVLSKYTCPKCQLKTCSLICTKKHKDIKNCTGQRDPVPYLSKNQITPKAVQKDYNFIQDMISGADKVKKVLSGVNNTINLQPRRFKILRNNARQLYNIKLSNGPNILERHRDNISFFFVKTKSIYWVFELLYFEGRSNNNLNEGLKTSRVLTQPTSDQKTFLDLLPEDYLNKQILQEKNINTTKRQQFFIFFENKQKVSEHTTEEQLSNKKKQNAVVSQRLVSGKFVTFYELIEYEISKKISEQMKDISLFEFPTLYVVHKSLREEFINSYKQVRLRNKQNSKPQNIKSSKPRQRQRQRSREKRPNRKQQKNEDNRSKQDKFQE